MIDRVTYHPLFETDVVHAAAWYDQNCAGLGNSFVENVRVGVDSVLADPERYAATEHGLRYQRIRRFPYILLFDVENDVLLFLGVLHTARSITKWKKTHFE